LFLPLQLQGGTFEYFDAQAAAFALFGDGDLLSRPGLGLTAVHETGAFGDHHRHAALPGPRVLAGLAEQLDHGFQLVGVRFGHQLDPAGAHDLGNGDSGRRKAIKGFSQGRRGLMAGHGGGAVIEDDQHKASALDDGVDQSGDAGVKEGGIPDGGAKRGNSLATCRIGVVEASRLADGGSHAEHRIDDPKVQAEGVAADIAGIKPFGKSLLDGEKGGPVRAAGAERRASAGSGRGCHRRRFGELQEGAEDALHHLGQELP